MLELAPEIEDHYSRSLDIVGDSDPYVGERCIGIKDVLKAHYLIANHFNDCGNGLGGVGPRSMDLLHSALYRQHVSYDGKPKWIHKYDVCATLFYGLIKNHPFHDANKRTAFLSLIYHLETLKLCPTISQRELEDFAVEVAENKLSKYKRYKDIEKKVSDKNDAPVLYISHFIKRNTREIDRKHYAVTYGRLKAILNRFGYDLQNPQNGFIDVVRTEERRKIFNILGPKENVNVKVTQIGFPGWKTQVSKGAIKKVRQRTKLTDDRGVDSQTFYKGEDPIAILVSIYQEPLRHLAGR